MAGFRSYHTATLVVNYSLPLALARLPAATIMGLDDAVSDSKILQLCLEAGILDYWSDEATSPNVDEALLEKWEKKLCYTGYSVAFHAVLPFVTVEVMGL